MRTYKHWDLMDSLPAGWTIDNHAGSPLAGYLFATNGSPLRGGKRALVRVVPAQRQLFDAGVVCSKMETTTPGPDEKSKPTQVVDAHYARTVNDLARAKFMRKLLADILVDLTICEIEGWCKHDYLNALVELINGIGRQPDLPPNVLAQGRAACGASLWSGGLNEAATRSVNPPPAADLSCITPPSW